MPGLLSCCVVLAIFNPLWVQALPSFLPPPLSLIKPVPTCPDNEFFNHEGKACELTCAMPLPQSPCNEAKVPGCECKIGYVRLETGECIDAVKCLDNASFNVEGAPPESKFVRIEVNEFLSAANETDSTNELETDSPPPPEGEEYDDTNEESKISAGIIPDVDDNPALVKDAVTVHNLITSPRFAGRASEYSEMIEFLREIIEKKMEEGDSYENKISYPDRYFY